MDSVDVAIPAGEELDPLADARVAAQVAARTAPPDGARAQRREAPSGTLLLDRVGDLLARVLERLGPDPAPAGPGPTAVAGGDLDVARGAVDLALERVTAELRDSQGPRRSVARGELLELGMSLQELKHSLWELRLTQRFEAVRRVQDALSRLRGVDSVAAMIDKAPEEVCRAGGFERAMLFQVRDSRLIAESVHYEHDPEGAAALLDYARSDPPLLNHMLLETEMLRRRVPMLVLDAQSDPRGHPGLVMATGTRSYVAAPIMPEGRVIGLLHADCHYSQRPLDEFDRDTLWAFAEGFGYALERTVLLERLRSQRSQVRQMMSATETILDELCESEIAVARVDSEDVAAAHTAAAMFASSDSQMHALLTRREVEVMGLMAAGETNAGIANRLVISEGTVKSHVRHILRKLRAANRAEAVSRYLRLGGEATD